MSSAVSALGGVSWSDGIATIVEAPLQGMITLRADLSDKAVRKVLKSVAKVDVPGPREANGVGERGLCWMSPDEILVLCPYASVAEDLATIQSALAGIHALAVDVSDARAMFSVKGSAAREVMAKLAPVDLAPGHFEPGMFRRTRIAQVAAAFWMPNDETFQIVCFRSQAQYMFDLLKVAAQKGSGVGYFHKA